MSYKTPHSVRGAKMGNFLRGSNDKEMLHRQALLLAVITIVYNILEGVVSVYFGLDDDTLALFGFGLDSFVEVLSGFGILHMLIRQRTNGEVNPDRFESLALRITGTAFYLLAIGLIVTAVINTYHGNKPDTTLWGIIIAVVSILTMWLLIHFKLKVGKALNSQAIVADANCTKVCMYLSLILFTSSVGYELTGIGGIDSIGAIAIALFSLREGREAFQKAKGVTCKCCDCASV